MAEAIGSGLQSLGNIAPSFLGGGPTGWMSGAGNYLTTPTPGAGTEYQAPTIPSADNPGLTPWSGGGVDSGTAATAGPPAGALPAYTAANLPSELPPTSVAPDDGSYWRSLSAAPVPSAAPGAGGAGGTTGTLTPVAGPGGLDPSTAAAMKMMGIDPTASQQPWWKTALLGTPATGAGGQATRGWPGLLSPAGLGLTANLGTGLMKYLQQRALMDPSAVAKAAQQMQAQETAAFKRNIAAPAIAAGQETGQINAPYLMDQAIATAAAPYVYQQYPESMQNYINSQELAMSLYPDAPSLVQPGIYGG